MHVWILLTVVFISRPIDDLTAEKIYPVILRLCKMGDNDYHLFKNDVIIDWQHYKQNKSKKYQQMTENLFTQLLTLL